MQILILLPILAFGLLVVALVGREEQRDKPRQWQGSFILASALWGAGLVALTEGLSLFGRIGRPGVVLGWTVMTVALLAWGRSSGSLGLGWARLRSLILGLDWLEWTVVVVVAGTALVLLAVVMAAPVNTVDVLQYHMPRVLQWAQNGSLRHFPAPGSAQNARPYWGEAVMLHLRVLWGSDEPVELLNWFSWLAIAVPASGGAQLLGANRSKVWLAALFAWTIPTAVLHATTAMVDLPAAYWAAALGYFVLSESVGSHGRTASLGVGLVTALGMLTKGTFFPFAAPLIALLGLTYIRRRNWPCLIRSAAMVAVIVTFLNAPFWARNLSTYGAPYGRSVPVQAVGDFVVDRDSQVDRPEFVVEPGSVETLVARGQKLTRMAVLHFVSPVGSFNQTLFAILDRHPAAFPPKFVDSMRLAAWNNVMNGGSPLHFLAVLAMIVTAPIVIQGRSQAHRVPIVGYALALLLGYLLLSLLRTADSVFGVRYQLALIVLAAPLIGPALVWTPRALVIAVGVGMLAYTAPYVMLNHTRPVMGRTPWPTKIDSVLATEDREILFAQSPTIADEYAAIARSIERASCSRVGLMISRKDLEYTLWWLLGAPEAGVRIGHLEYSEPLGVHRKEVFEPCAVICTVCDEQAQMGQLPLAVDGGHIRLYMRSDR